MFLSRRRPPCFFNDNFVKRQLELVNSVVTRLEFQSVVDGHLSPAWIWHIDMICRLATGISYLMCNYSFSYFKNFNFECNFFLKNVWYCFWCVVDNLNGATYTLFKNLWMKCCEVPDYFPLFWRKPRQDGYIWNDNNLWFILCLP